MILRGGDFERTLDKRNVEEQRISFASGLVQAPEQEEHCMETYGNMIRGLIWRSLRRILNESCMDQAGPT